MMWQRLVLFICTLQIKITIVSDKTDSIDDDNNNDDNIGL